MRRALDWTVIAAALNFLNKRQRYSKTVVQIDVNLVCQVQV